MQNVVTITQIVLSLAIIGLVLMQARGTGFARTWGNPASFTRRGLEKIVFRLTFLIVALFIIISIIQLI